MAAVPDGSPAAGGVSGDRLQPPDPDRVVHDLGEAIRGDIPAIDQDASAPKSADERNDLVTLTAPLPPRLQDEILALRDEYEAAATPEAKVAKALDKLETILQHNQGKNRRILITRSILVTGSGTRAGIR